MSRAAAFSIAGLVALATLAGCGPTLIWSGHTPDRRHRVDVIQDAGLQYVVVDGERRAAYRGIAGSSIAFSEGHLAFAARVGARWTIVADGRVSETWDAIGALVISRSGQLAYAAERDHGWYVVLDGHRGPRFDSIIAGTLQLGRDQEHVSYVGESAGRVTAVIDGVRGPELDGIGQLIVDGAHHAYAARRALDAYVVVDGVPSRPWSAVKHLELAGGHVAYAASDGTEWRVILDGVPGPAVDRVSRILLSADGLHHAWIARVAEQDVLALDDLPLLAAPKLRASTVVFRPHSAGLAYVEPVEPRGERVVMGELRGPTYEEVGVPVWSADGQRFAYAARRDRNWVMIVDGRELAGGSHVGDPVFSADGRRVAFVARRGKVSVLVVDGHDQRFDLAFEDSVVFSADNRRWAIVAGDLGHEQMFIAIEGGARIALPAVEIYSAATRANAGNVLRSWAQIEADRAAP